ncbi:acyltransferase [Xylophilus sp. Kf1]|nr:acyltransferase [Xylophilus sp. Kf1]
MISLILDFFYKSIPRIRALPWRLLSFRFKRVGRGLRLMGGRGIVGGENAAFGVFCWLECVFSYKGISHLPKLSLGRDISASDFLHVSCAGRIQIGDGCLIGSRVYIGDNSHGALSSYGGHSLVNPAERPLAGVQEINIGARCWIGDGTVILAGASIAADSVVGANSVVRIKVDRPALIAGVPATVLRYLDE